VADVELVFHVLGTLVAPSREKFEEVNVEPVRLLLDACAGRTEVKRFVLVSSQGAVGPNPEGAIGLTEEAPCHPVSDYGRSKLAAEEVTRAYADKVAYTIVRPSIIYGPRDTSTLRFFRWGKKGKLPDVGREEKAINLTHVRDITDGIFRAAMSENGRNQTYHLASERAYSMEDMRRAIELAMDTRIRRFRIPYLVVQLLMLRSDLLALFGKHILMNRDRLATVSYPHWVLDITKAKQQLGYRETVTLEDGFAETYAWYRTEGWV
jgi:nucleoside-diphosphate-sugar epimerase